MARCYFCENDLMKLVPLTKISGSWTRAGGAGDQVRWACEYCADSKTENYNG